MVNIKQCPHILLINPPVYDFAVYDLFLKPLGLLYIANVLRNLGYRISFIDCLYRFHPSLPKNKIKSKNYGCGHFYSVEVEKPEILKSVPRKYKRYGLPKNVIISELDKIDRPDLILVSSGMTYWYPGVVEIIDILNKKFPSVPIILGGIYATLCYTHAQRCSGADYIFYGGDIAELVTFIEKILGYKSSFTEKLSAKDFSCYPVPAFDLYPYNEYAVLRTSIGCPLNCSYCAVNILTPKGFQRKPVETVFNEIKYFYYNLNIKNIVFYDDALLYQNDIYLAPILERVIKETIQCNFHTPNGLHARFVGEKIARLMYNAGFIHPRISLETVNPIRQKQTGDKVTTEEFIRAVRYLTQAGYNPQDIGVYIMMGVPGQTYDEVEESIYYVKSLGLKVHLAEYSPIPGSRDWVNENIANIIPYDDPLWHNNSLFPLYQLSEWEKFQKLKNLAHNL